MSAGVFPKVPSEVITLEDYNNLQALAFQTKTSLLGQPCLSSQKTRPSVPTQADWNNLKADIDYCITFGAITTASIATKIPFTSVVATNTNIYYSNAIYADAVVKWPINIVISTSTQTFVLSTEIVSRGYTGTRVGKSAITIVVTTGTVVGSTSTLVAALPVTGLTLGDDISIVNYGRITGRGGAGGRGANYGGSAVAGSPGGTAIQTAFPVSINNAAGIIAGGGGGGGGGGYYSVTNTSGKTTVTTYYAGDGGGGGAGLAGGTGGGGGTGADVNGTAGSAGTTTAGGADGGNAGGGGGPGVAGGGGGNFGSGLGGIAGSYIVGNSFVTWASTGTRLGSVV